MEKRTITIDTEIRAAEGETPEISGRGAVVGITTDLGWFEEEISADAFREADLTDVLVCFNHDLNIVLGRNSAKSAEISIDDTGNLSYRVLNPDLENPSVNSVYRYIQRGEVSKSSFMFDIQDDVWSKSDKYGDYGKRTITKIGKVYEAGPVTLPAYNDTTAEAKSALQRRDAFVANIKPEITDEQEKDAEWRNYYNLILK